MVKWIEGCLNSTTIALFINGSTSAFFTSSRGLRKGSPSSPLLFLLVAEGHSRLVSSVRKNGREKSIKIGRNCLLPHLLFLDDVFLFGNGSCRDAQWYKEILDLYMHATGIEVNAL